jgi:hypothetical protein
MSVASYSNPFCDPKRGCAKRSKQILSLGNRLPESKSLLDNQRIPRFVHWDLKKKKKLVPTRCRRTCEFSTACCRCHNTLYVKRTWRVSTYPYRCRLSSIRARWVSSEEMDRKRIAVGTRVWLTCVHILCWLFGTQDRVIAEEQRSEQKQRRSDAGKTIHCFGAHRNGARYNNVTPLRFA